jgi:hypothetical protein
VPPVGGAVLALPDSNDAVFTDDANAVSVRDAAAGDIVVLSEVVHPTAESRDEALFDEVQELQPEAETEAVPQEASSTEEGAGIGSGTGGLEPSMEDVASPYSLTTKIDMGEVFAALFPILILIFVQGYGILSSSHHPVTMPPGDFSAGVYRLAQEATGRLPIQPIACRLMHDPDAWPWQT